ncbi:MAG: hypothetical protein ACOXZK_12150 [Bacteroidales bacterium]|jgi:FtsH-binding integral membrane protein
MFKKLYQKFTVHLLIISIILMATKYLLTHLKLDIVTPYFAYIILLFVIVAATFQYLLLRSVISNPRKFILFFLGGTISKLFLYFGFLVYFLLVVSVSPKIFIFNFAIIYIIYTMFEIVSTLYQLKKIGDINQKDKQIE